MPVFRKKDTRPYWDQLESEFDAGSTIVAWLTLTLIALAFGVVAWLVEGYVWPSLRSFFS
jgi:hypothetical protein